MLELAVASFCANQPPAFLLNPLYNISDLQLVLVLIAGTVERHILNQRFAPLYRLCLALGVLRHFLAPASNSLGSISHLCRPFH